MAQSCALDLNDLGRVGRGEERRSEVMNRRFVLVLALVGMMFAGAVQARGWSNFSFGYSDYGRHGGYSVSLGGFGGHHWGGLGWSSPGSYGHGFDYGYRNHWRDSWNLSSYGRGYYDDCYYGCRGYNRSHYPSPRHYSGHDYPRHDRYYRSYDRGYRHDRHDRYNRHDRHGLSGYGRDYSHNRYDRSYRADRSSERAYDRAREESRGLSEGSPRGRREY